MSATIKAQEETELFNSQITQLLKDAEQRMRASSQSLTQDKPKNSLLTKSTSLSVGSPVTPYIKTTAQGAHVDSSRLVKTEERKLANTIRVVEDPVLVKNNNAKAQKATAGSEWFNMPRTNLTPELKRDLQLLRMRSVLDPKRHYKKDNKKSDVPEFSQVGTIIEGPTEHSARLTKKQRKRTLVEEVLAAESGTHRFKSKYKEIQKAKTSGKKEDYRKRQAMRKSKKT